MRLALLTLLAAAGPLAAQPEPTLELRAATAGDLLAAARFATDFLGGRETVKAAAELLTAADAGLDLRRPWGFTATMTADVIDSPAVVVAPLADAATFRRFVAARLDGPPKQLPGGLSALSLPGVPVPVYFKTVGDTLFLSAVNATSLDAANLPDPSKFFAEKSAHRVVARLHYQRIPADVRAVVFAEWELQANDGMRRARRGETPAETKLRQWLLEQTLPLIKATFDDGDTLAVTFDRDPASDDVRLGATFTAAPDTPLARGIAALNGRPGRALPPLTGAKLLNTTARFGLPDAAKPGFPAVVDARFAETVEALPAGQQLLVKLAAEPFLPTLRAGEIDLAVGVTTDAKPGGVRLLADAAVVDGGGIERTLRQLAAFVPKGTAAVTFDAATAGGLKLHAVELKAKPAGGLIDGSTVSLGTSSDRLLVAAEPTGKLVAKAADFDPNPNAPVIELAAAPVALANAFATPGTAAAPAADDFLRLTVTGGDAVTLTFEVSGKALAFLRGDAAKP